MIVAVTYLYHDYRPRIVYVDSNRLNELNTVDREILRAIELGREKAIVMADGNHPEPDISSKAILTERPATLDRAVIVHVSFEGGSNMTIMENETVRKKDETSIPANGEEGVTSDFQKIGQFICRDKGLVWQREFRRRMQRHFQGSLDIRRGSENNVFLVLKKKNLPPWSALRQFLFGGDRLAQFRDDTVLVFHRKIFELAVGIAEQMARESHDKYKVRRALRPVCSVNPIA